MPRSFPGICVRTPGVKAMVICLGVRLSPVSGMVILNKKRTNSHAKDKRTLGSQIKPNSKGHRFFAISWNERRLVRCYADTALTEFQRPVFFQASL